MARNGISVPSGQGDLPFCLTQFFWLTGYTSRNDLLEATVNQ